MGKGGERFVEGVREKDGKDAKRGKAARSDSGDSNDSSGRATTPTASAAAAAAALQDKELPVITMEEVAQHRTPEDAWLVYRDHVYDVSGWHEHPGGTVMFSHAGDDCTDIFTAFHPPSARDALQRFRIGRIDRSSQGKTDEQRAFEDGYRDLRNRLLQQGLFRASLPYYVFKVASNLAILALGVACVLCFPGSLAMHMLGAVLVGLFWQQCGWLSHDFLHHQVFKNRFYGDLMGYFLGNVCQGFSVAWWKDKHNTHHAVPNLHESNPDAHDGDPDIDTMPLLAWSRKMAEQARQSESGSFFIRNQSLLYFPILLLARFAWLNQSWYFLYGWAAFTWETKHSEMARQNIPNFLLERVSISLYWVWNVALMLCMPWHHAVLFFLVSQMSCGLMLATVFGLGHNGMSTYEADARPDFWKLQVTTTRNVTSNLFVDWFCGGLQYQVEHHLFPTLPRHNLHHAHAAVHTFCAEQGVKYHEASMWDGTIEVLQHLDEVATDFIVNGPGM